MRAKIITAIFAFLVTLFIGTTAAQAQYGRIEPRYERQDRYEQRYGRYTLYADGVNDDTQALNAFGRGERVFYRGRVVDRRLVGGTFLVSGPVTFSARGAVRNNTFIFVGNRRDVRNLITFGYGVRNDNNRIQLYERNYDRRRGARNTGGLILRFPF